MRSPDAVPAFVYPFIEAMADGAVACGLPGPRLSYAAQTLVGAAKLVLESGDHPGALKDAVLSRRIHHSGGAGAGTERVPPHVVGRPLSPLTKRPWRWESSKWGDSSNENRSKSGHLPPLHIPPDG